MTGSSSDTQAENNEPQKRQLIIQFKNIVELQVMFQ